VLRRLAAHQSADKVEQKSAHSAVYRFLLMPLPPSSSAKCNPSAGSVLGGKARLSYLIPRYSDRLAFANAHSLAFANANANDDALANTVSDSYPNCVTNTDAHAFTHSPALHGPAHGGSRSPAKRIAG
jgi:hypothetical protein